MPHAHPSGFPPRCLAVPVARWPVPRERQPARKPHANQRRFPDRGMARDRPSPYGRCLAVPVARWPVPRERQPARKPHANQRRFPDRGMARDRPSPYGNGDRTCAGIGTGPRPTATETGFARSGQRACGYQQSLWPPYGNGDRICALRAGTYI